jgi:hypothetical protein
MERLWRYYGTYQSLRGDVGGLPSWARTILVIVALPGIAAIALSILVFLVSLSALLLLTVPLYRLLKALTGGGATPAAGRPGEVMTGAFSESGLADGFTTPGRKRVDATVIEQGEETQRPSDGMRADWH